MDMVVALQRFKNPGVRPLFVLTVLCCCSSLLWAQTPQVSTAAAAEYSYRAKNLGDPFVSLLAAGGASAGAAMASSEPAADLSIEDLEKAFNPDDLVVRALVKDAKRGEHMAILASLSNPGEGYVIRGSRVRHMASGLVLGVFSAKIQKDSVIISRTKGDPLMATVGFPQDKEEGGSP
ncbi:MAG: hypothetical protein HYT79_05290 [Elusimicrobia bacterium]|nr:hypothetical protein [Elusimicrobiota bacterium]